MDAKWDPSKPNTYHLINDSISKCLSSNGSSPVSFTALSAFVFSSLFGSVSVSSLSKILSKARPFLVQTNRFC
uniref:Uncharacterized protein n=1 Tax=Salix viminalis TaxID=40686 RepID=A0A6N2KI15_SALVM